MNTALALCLLVQTFCIFSDTEVWSDMAVKVKLVEPPVFFSWNNATSCLGRCHMHFCLTGSSDPHQEVCACTRHAAQSSMLTYFKGCWRPILQILLRHFLLTASSFKLWGIGSDAFFMMVYWILNSLPCWSHKPKIVHLLVTSQAHQFCVFLPVVGCAGCWVKYEDVCSDAFGETVPT